MKRWNSIDVIVSVDPFNHGPLDLIVAIPITSTQRDGPTHVELRTAESGLKMKSFVKCEDVRSMSSVRLVKRIGGVSQQKMEVIADRLRIILGL